MSILVRGKTVCHLCDAVIAGADEAQQFPQALFDPGSDLAHLNDSSVHTSCLNDLPQADFVRARLEDFLAGCMPSARQRRFTAMVPTSGTTAFERVSVLAVSRFEAANLLRETYGQDLWFDLIDAEAATRPR